MVDKDVESSEILFSGEMIKYTTVFNKVKRSIYGTDCNVFKIILEYRELFLYPLQTSASENVLNKFKIRTSLENTVNSYRARIGLKI